MDAFAFLNNSTLFSGISENQLRDISLLLQPIHLEPGNIIFTQGDDGDAFYLIYSGIFRIFVNNLNGQETSILLLGRPGQLLGELSMIDGLPRSASVEALTKAMLYRLKKEHFFHLMENTRFAQNLILAISLKLRNTTERVDTLAALSIFQRTSLTLLKLADYGHVKPNGIYLDALITQDDLATFVGASRESVNKKLHQLQTKSIIKVERKRIIILDKEALYATVNA